jgi:hypothetical protein
MGREEKDDLAELSKEISKVIADNKKFLDRVLDDDFEPDPAEVAAAEAEAADDDEAGEMIEL